MALAWKANVTDKLYQSTDLIGVRILFSGDAIAQLTLTNDFVPTLMTDRPKCLDEGAPPPAIVAAN